MTEKTKLPQEIKPLEIFGVCTDGHTQLALQTCRAYENGIFSTHLIGLTLTDLSTREPNENALFLTATQAQNLIQQLTTLTKQIEKLNKPKNAKHPK